MRKVFNSIKRNLFLMILLAIFLAGNYLLSYFPLRLDFSQNKAYSLSKSTKKLISSLKNKVEIRFYLSSELPTRMVPLKNDVLDFLKEYQRYSKKINLKILDPKKDNKALEQVRTDGIPELQFSQLERDKYEVKNVYFGLALQSKDKKEIIPQINDLEGLEYNLTTSIYKLTKDRLEKIAIVGKKEEFLIEKDDLSVLKDTLRKQFELDFINIDKDSSIEKISKDYKVLLVFDDNEKEYQQEEIKKINNYLGNGGKAIFFVSGAWVGESFYTRPANHNLFNLLESWGVDLKKNLILSSTAEIVNFGNQNVQFITLYPYWIRTDNLDKKESITNSINLLTFHWASSVSFKEKNNLEGKVIVYSKKRSWEQKISTESAFFADPNLENIVQPLPNQFKEFPLVLMIKNIKNNGQILIIPSNRFILDNYLSRTSDNLKFVLNVINDFSAQNILSGIHQRAVSFYPLPDLPENQEEIVKYLLMFFLPVVYLSYGLIKVFRSR